MNNLSHIGIKKTSVKLKQADTRVIKIRKFIEYEEREAVDFTINSIVLSDLIKNADPGIPTITTGLQSNFATQEKIKYLQRLKGEQPADLDSGRVALYLCPLDGDLTCDTVGCRISFDKETVTWHDFAWDGNIGESIDEEDEDEPDEMVKGLWRFIFSRKEYEALINELIGGYSVTKK